MTRSSPRLLSAAVALLLLVPAARAQINWNVTFEDVVQSTGVGFDDPSQSSARQASLVSALNYISTQFDGRGTIQLDVAVSSMTGTGDVATGTPTYVPTAGFTNGVAYRRATTGTSPLPGTPDATVFFNFGYNFTASGGGGGYDLQSVALHEVTHALGFGSQIGENGQGALNNPVGTSDLYNDMARFYQVGSAPGGVSLINSDASFNSSATAADLTSNNIYFNGAIATAANGGSMVQIDAPSSFVTGSSLNHVDPSGPGANAVMQPGTNDASTGTHRAYQPFEVGMMVDAGWNKYTWVNSNSDGNWGDNKTSTTNSPWLNYDGRKELSPVGTITPNLVLTFNGGLTVGYTSTNNLDLSSNNNRFLVNQLVLNSPSVAPITIAAESNQVLKFDTTIGVTPGITQQNSGAFVISHPIELTGAGMNFGGTGTGQVAITGNIGQAAGQTANVTFNGAGAYALGGANTYTGTTTVASGELRVLNTAGSATGTGAVTVQAGTVLSGYLDHAAKQGGFITGNVTIESGAVVRPGTTDLAHAGQINFTNSNQTITFASGSVYVWSLVGLSDLRSDAGLKYDQLTVANSGSLNLSGGQLELAFNSTTNPLNGDPFWSSSHMWEIVSSANGGRTPVFGGITNGGNYSSVGTFALLPYYFGSVELTYTPLGGIPPTPEPTTVMGIAALGLGAVAGVRRLKQKANEKARP